MMKYIENKKVHILFLAVIMILLAIMSVSINAQAFAFTEENTETNEVSVRGADTDNLSIPIVGTFKDNKREYGSFLMNINVTRIALVV